MHCSSSNPEQLIILDFASIILTGCYELFHYAWSPFSVFSSQLLSRIFRIFCTDHHSIIALRARDPTCTHMRNTEQAKLWVCMLQASCSKLEVAVLLVLVTHSRNWHVITALSCREDSRLSFSLSAFHRRGRTGCCRTALAFIWSHCACIIGLCHTSTDIAVVKSRSIPLSDHLRFG